MIDFTTLAYLDPGAGSLLLQALVGGSAGLYVFIKHVWRSFRYSRSSQFAARIEE